MPSRHLPYLCIFQKSASQGLPRHRYHFWVELMPGAAPQASRIISLSPAENEVLETTIDKGLANSTILIFCFCQPE
ncbi:uncharacterized protein VP01_7089g1 [Puccinia sorghi]|uniref:Uncharacterized protein n=1 Tax=Puccinia sorghi TaxID=27349 RepID=A0A0L6UEG9_9BASI|nr:uncharacterized protein VP01_7089g1 [Puccinia sorghi]